MTVNSEANKEVIVLDKKQMETNDYIKLVAQKSNELGLTGHVVTDVHVRGSWSRKQIEIILDVMTKRHIK
jgi:hypothetical protein